MRNGRFRIIALYALANLLQVFRGPPSGLQEPLKALADLRRGEILTPRESFLAALHGIDKAGFLLGVARKASRARLRWQSASAAAGSGRATREATAGLLVKLYLPNANEARRPGLDQLTRDSHTELAGPARLAGPFHRGGEGAVGQAVVARA